MHEMRLPFYLEETGKGISEFAREVNRDRKAVWWWVNKMDVWVEVDDEMRVKVVKSFIKRQLYP
jgi:hypothetical protein